MLGKHGSNGNAGKSFIQVMLVRAFAGHHQQPSHSHQQTYTSQSKCEQQYLPLTRRTNNGGSGTRKSSGDFSHMLYVLFFITLPYFTPRRATKVITMLLGNEEQRL
jgi:hypothetical protein